MRTSAWIVTLLGALVSLGLTMPAHAMGRLLTAPTSSARIERIRMAVTNAPGRSTLWFSSVLAGETPAAAWVLAVPPGTVADRTSSRWFWALDEATGPRVFPPLRAVEGPCGVQGIYQSTIAPRSPEHLSISDAKVFTEFSDLEAYVAARSLVLSAADRTVLGSGARWLALALAAPGPGVWTEPVRLVYPAPLPGLELAVMRDSVDLPVTLFVLGEEASFPRGLVDVRKERLETTWFVSDGGSDYLSARTNLLTLYRGLASVREYVGSAALLDGIVLPEGGGFVASAPALYHEFANAVTTTGARSDECVEGFADFQEQAARASLPCPVASLAAVPFPDGSEPRCESSPASGFDAQTLACETADDLAYAFGGLKPDAVVTRLELLVGANSPPRLELVAEPPVEFSCTVRALGIDPAICLGGITGAGGAGAGGTDLGQQGTSASQDTDLPQTVVEEPEPEPVLAEPGCSCGAGTSSSSADEGCDGGSEEQTSGDGCDSGDDSSTDADGCDSDADSGYSGDTCGSSSEGGGCDSSGGEGYSGDTCSSGGGGGGDCSVVKPRLRRFRLSPCVVLACAILLPLRRRGRTTPARSARVARSPK